MTTPRFVRVNEETVPEPGASLGPPLHLPPYCMKKTLGNKVSPSSSKAEQQGKKPDPDSYTETLPLGAALRASDRQT